MGQGGYIIKVPSVMIGCTQNNYESEMILLITKQHIILIREHFL